jgi:hypothetical protein
MVSRLQRLLHESMVSLASPEDAVGARPAFSLHKVVSLIYPRALFCTQMDRKLRGVSGSFLCRPLLRSTSRRRSCKTTGSRVRGWDWLCGPGCSVAPSETQKLAQGEEAQWVPFRCGHSGTGRPCIHPTPPAWQRTSSCAVSPTPAHLPIARRDSQTLRFYCRYAALLLQVRL